MQRRNDSCSSKQAKEMLPFDVSTKWATSLQLSVVKSALPKEKNKGQRPLSVSPSSRWNLESTSISLSLRSGKRSKEEKCFFVFCSHVYVSFFEFAVSNICNSSQRVLSELLNHTHNLGSHHLPLHPLLHLSHLQSLPPPPSHPSPSLTCLYQIPPSSSPIHPFFPSDHFSVRFPTTPIACTWKVTSFFRQWWRASSE